MSVLSIGICFVLGLGVVWLLLPLIIRWSRVRLAERMPSFHQTNETPVPRFGGLALAVAFVAVFVAAGFIRGGEPLWTVQNLGLAGAALAMFALGFADDFRPIGARKKLLGQILIASVAAVWVSHIQVVKNPLDGQTFELGWIGPVATVLWLVAFTNLINLIDGIDGLAGGIALMLMGLLVYGGAGMGAALPVCIAAGMAGALVAFLRHNFPPAKIYLGDGGAYLLGFLIGLLAMLESHKGTVAAALVAPLFALALPIIDVTLAILRRAVRGLPIFRADRKHLHHRLLVEGFSRRKTVLILYGFSVVCLLMAFGVFWSEGRWVAIFLGLGCLLLLLAASRLNFAREWFAVGRVLGHSLEMRKACQHALALAKWFELEAERCSCAEDLWSDYGFLAGKLGFLRARLRCHGTEKVWEAETLPQSGKQRQRTVSLHQGRGSCIEFTADAARMNGNAFEQISDLAAEAWLKGANRWQTVWRRPLRFAPLPPPPAGGAVPQSSALAGVAAKN
jgi:UDP-GlcNAc:undecaprenyl-phosphate GlcNAc-1-phosphate transferase